MMMKWLKDDRVEQALRKMKRVLALEARRAAGV